MRIDNLKTVLPKLIGKYSFEVGILEDGGTRKGVPKTMSTYAGGPVRSGRKDGGSMNDRARDLIQRYGWLRKPFTKESNSAIREFANNYVKEIGKQHGTPNKKRLENLMQAIVRNPILRGDYGHNSPVTVKIKGFDRVMIDTGTFFRAIKAKLVTNG